MGAGEAVGVNVARWCGGATWGGSPRAALLRRSAHAPRVLRGRIDTPGARSSPRGKLVVVAGVPLKKGVTDLGDDARGLPKRIKIFSVNDGE